ncbi:type II and III secretion system protein [Thermodesulfobium narugense DSM 14796]|uniref:Type II and III secretion system protein n=1 Tax=Thermodesulfobium narugense DSM 14796 TaxID=747365 RepID=M1E5E0_9BACT|nr:secretin N-terminal domain-containing protein [Thermodesulfobium narugense]AEE14211.1 type II and III secretion system protein [Thermodesulfobium narugense DSM 14796]
MKWFLKSCFFLFFLFISITSYASDKPALVNIGTNNQDTYDELTLTFSGPIDLNSISEERLNYPDCIKFTFKNVNLSLKPGQKIFADLSKIDYLSYYIVPEGVELYAYLRDPDTSVSIQKTADNVIKLKFQSKEISKSVQTGSPGNENVESKSSNQNVSSSGNANNLDSGLYPKGFNLSNFKSQTSNEQNESSNNYQAENSPMISYMAFKGADIRDVLATLARLGGYNLVAADSVKGSVTVDLKDISVDDAIKLVTKINNFSMQKVGNVLVIGTDKDLSNFGVIRVYKLYNVGNKTIIETSTSATAGGGTSGGASGLTINKVTTMRQGVDVAKLIAEGIGASFSSTKIASSSGGGESTSTSSSSNSSGKVLYDDRTNTITVIAPEDKQKIAEELLQNLDKPLKQIEVQVMVIELDNQGIKQLGIQWPNNIQFSGNATGTRTYGTSKSKSSVYTGTISNITASLYAQLNNNNAKILSDPRILALDGQDSYVFAGDKLYIPQVSSATGGNVTYTTNEYDVGVLLKITPFIGENGEITIHVTPSVSAFNGDVTQLQINQPFTTTIREADVTARVKDGQTFYIGGLISDEQRKQTISVPGLGNMPLLGPMFRYDYNMKSRTEVIFLLTPHIVKNS